MKALITGGAGFIGSHLADALLEAGHDVVVIDDLSTGSAANIAHLEGRPRFRFIRGTVRDEAAMAPLVNECDVVYHLAAAVGVTLIVDRPVDTIETNIDGTAVVLSLAARSDKKVLLASSSEVYGKGTDTPFREDDDTVLGSTDHARCSYACSKLADEFLALAHHDQNGLDAVVVRIFNTIGPRQTGQYGMVVPRFIKAALAAQPLEVYGDGRQTRCFCNVADLVSGLVALADCPAAVGRVVNLGADEPITIDDLADKVIALTGSTSTKRLVSYEQAYGRAFDDMLVRVPDLSRARKLIGYKPNFTLDQTLRQIVDYQKKQL